MISIAAYHAATQRFTDSLADARARAAGHAVGAAIVAVIDKVDAHGADWRKAVPDMQLKLAEDPASFERAFDVPVSPIGTLAHVGTPQSRHSGAQPIGAWSDATSAVAVRQLAISQTVQLLGSLAATLIAALAGWALSLTIARPVRRMTDVMSELANGNFSSRLPGLGRRDELGQMARAVEEFKTQAIAKAQREASEREEKARELEQTRKAELRKFADHFETAVGENRCHRVIRLDRVGSRRHDATKTAETTQQLSTIVAGASEEASANVRAVAVSTEEMSSSVTEIDRQVHDV